MSMSPITGEAPTTIHTSADGLTAGRVSIPTFDGQIDAYHAVQQGKKGAPVVLVVQEIFGLHEHIQDICRRLAHAGYFAIGVELYQRQGDPNGYPDIPSLVAGLVTKVPDEQVLADMDASAKWAGEHGGDASRLGVTGYCWGGRITWLYAAHNPACKAGVAWYGKLIDGHGPVQKYQPIDIAGKLLAPVLGLYGALDAGIPVEGVHKMQAALAAGSTAASKASQIVIYPESNHAFYADYRPSYRAPDAKDAEQKMLAWFKQYL